MYNCGEEENFQLWFVCGLCFGIVSEFLLYGIKSWGSFGVDRR